MRFCGLLLQNDRRLDHSLYLDNPAVLHNRNGELDILKFYARRFPVVRNPPQNIRNQPAQRVIILVFADIQPQNLGDLLQVRASVNQIGRIV